MTPQNPYGWWLPLNISSIGPQLDQLFYIVHGFMAVLFVGWGIFFAYVLWRFRARPGHRAEYATDTKHLNTYLEVGVIVFELVLIFVFSLPLWASAKYQLPDAKDAVNVEVVAEQFAWNIRYPGPDGKFGKRSPALMNLNNPIGLDRTDKAAQDDVVTSNELVVPKGKPVLINLTSKDVIHSFYLPVVRVKQDAIPGQSIKIWFQATETGDFEIACAQLCGAVHYRMKGQFLVRDADEFDSWLKGQGESVQAQAAASAPSDF
ncbi:MAG: cytochrome c oxidase subunit II [Elusimicrobia bacterium]|nr:cytochrome c oxidase subunit II [Elusimicrobiota bacterium]